MAESALTTRRTFFAAAGATLAAAAAFPALAQPHDEWTAIGAEIDHLISEYDRTNAIRGQSDDEIDAFLDWLGPRENVVLARMADLPVTDARTARIKARGIWLWYGADRPHMEMSTNETIAALICDLAGVA